MFVLIYIEVGINSSLMLCIFPHTIKPFNKRERNKKKGNSLSQDTSLQWFSVKVDFAPREQFWQCPEIFLVVTMGRRKGVHITGI